MNRPGLEFLRELHRNLKADDPFAAAALKDAMEYAKTSLPDCEISLAIVHLAATIGEFKRQVAGITASTEGQLTAIDNETT